MRQQMERMRLEAERAQEMAAMLMSEREHRLCGVCLERERTEALVPCGHTYCSVCVTQLPTRLCPECVQPFSRTQRLFGFGNSTGSSLS